MKTFITFILVSLLLCPLYAQDMEVVSEEPQQETQIVTSYYFIRHAEKDRSDAKNKDPHLTQQGFLRAAKWSYVLENVKFDAVYSTKYNRTIETGQPTAEKNEINALTFYDPDELDMKGFIENTSGQNVLVVGHSNTTPRFVNKIIGKEKYEQIDDKNNANLYIVTIGSSGEKLDILLVID